MYIAHYRIPIEQSEIGDYLTILGIFLILPLYFYEHVFNTTHLNKIRGSSIPTCFTCYNINWHSNL